MSETFAQVNAAGGYRDEETGEWHAGTFNELVKRVPQLASAHAGIAASEAAVKKAARDLERTEIRVPYDCRLERTYVDVGAVIAPGMPLADLDLGQMQLPRSVALRTGLSLDPGSSHLCR